MFLMVPVILNPYHPGGIRTTENLKGQFGGHPAADQPRSDRRATQLNSPKAFFLLPNKCQNSLLRHLKASYATANHPKLPHPLGDHVDVPRTARSGPGLALTTYHRDVHKLEVY